MKENPRFHVETRKIITDLKINVYNTSIISLPHLFVLTQNFLFINFFSF